MAKDQEREKRLAEALRANLRKRKASPITTPSAPDEPAAPHCITAKQS
jgi:hypothetical protein